MTILPKQETHTVNRTTAKHFEISGIVLLVLGVTVREREKIVSVGGGDTCADLINQNSELLAIIVPEL